MNYLPEKTIVNQKIPKEAFYKNLKLSSKLKKSLIDDVESIVVTHSLKSNPHKLLIKLKFNNRLQYLFYENKLYKSEWKDSFKLDYDNSIKTLDALWNYIIIHVLSIEERFDSDKNIITILECYNKIKELEVSIDRLERKIYKEVQPKKKFKLYQELQLLKQSLEECING